MDNEIQETVEAILGKNVTVIDCEKKCSIKEEEVLLVNGCPVTLDGDDGVAIKEALLHGNIPNCHSLNQILVRVGILKAPVKLETNLSVKSNVVTREEVTVAKGGQVVDERSRETKEDNFYTSNTSEIWEPMGILSNSANSDSNLPSLSVDFSIRGNVFGEESTACCSSSCSNGENDHNSTHTDSSNCHVSIASMLFPSRPHKYSETRTSNMSKTCFSNHEDKSSLVHSKCTLSGSAPPELPIHVLPFRMGDTTTIVSPDSGCCAQKNLLADTNSVWADLANDATASLFIHTCAHVNV